MDVLLYIVMALLGFVGSFFSGLLGIGGAIINYPLLLFVPPSLGSAEFTAQEVSSISMFQVFFASLAGVLAFRKKKGSSTAVMVHKGLVVYMGSSILIGSLIGAFGSRLLNGEVINIIYGTLALIAIVLMLVSGKGDQQEDAAGEITFSKGIAITSALIVGIVSGVVGAGGAFILIPIMLTLLKIPARITIASSLAIVFISAIGGIIGKIMAGQIPYMPTLFTVLGSLLGAPIGARVSSKINVKVLQYGLVVLIAITAVKVWMSIL
jgi:uncharacterized membrane protein YfcA